MAQRLDTLIFNGYACMAPFCQKLFWKWDEAKRHMHHECKALPRSTKRPREVESIRKALDIGRKHREDHPELKDDGFILLNANDSVLRKPREVGRKQREDNPELNNDGNADGDVRQDGKSQGAPTIEPLTATAPTAPPTGGPSDQLNTSIFNGYACLACSCQAMFWKWEEAKRHMLLACATFPRSIKRPREAESIRKALDIGQKQRGEHPELNDGVISVSSDDAVPGEGAFPEARTITPSTATAPPTAAPLPKPTTVADFRNAARTEAFRTSQGVRPQSKKRPRPSKIPAVPPLPNSSAADISNLQMVLWEESASAIPPPGAEPKLLLSPPPPPGGPGSCPQSPTLAFFHPGPGPLGACPSW